MFTLLGKLFALGDPLWYYWPLVIIVGLVYKTTQHDDPRAIGRAVLHFAISVTALMLVLALVLYGISEWA